MNWMEPSAQAAWSMRPQGLPNQSRSTIWDICASSSLEISPAPQSTRIASPNMFSSAADDERPPPAGTVLVTCAVNQRHGGVDLVIAGIGAREVDLEGLAPFALDTRDQVVALLERADDGAVECGGDDMPALMVGVVAGDLGTAGRDDLEQLAHIPIRFSSRTCRAHR